MHTINRKGATSIKNIPKDVMFGLNNGLIETVNLVEWLAIDQLVLLSHVLNNLRQNKYLKDAELAVNALKKSTVNTRNEAIGISLLQQSKKHKDKDLLNQLTNHLSDMARCWAVIMIGKSDKKLKEKFEEIEIFAMDHHFGVREIAWLAIRQDIISNLDVSIKTLSQWSYSNNENLRRFASEATRPRGVWCEHISALKENPELAIHILEPLKSDSSLYVRNSVANWINDAGKSSPTWAKELCKRWEKESQTKETESIIKRALRNLN
jgi:3-methyladenine DNA glycosylase AlkC